MADRAGDRAQAALHARVGRLVTAGAAPYGPAPPAHRGLRVLRGPHRLLRGRSPLDLVSAGHARLSRTGSGSFPIFVARARPFGCPPATVPPQHGHGPQQIQPLSRRLELASPLLLLKTRKPT